MGFFNGIGTANVGSTPVVERDAKMIVTIRSSKVEIAQLGGGRKGPRLFVEYTVEEVLSQGTGKDADLQKGQVRRWSADAQNDQTPGRFLQLIGAAHGVDMLQPGEASDKIRAHAQALADLCEQDTEKNPLKGKRVVLIVDWTPMKVAKEGRTHFAVHKWGPLASLAAPAAAPTAA